MTNNDDGTVSVLLGKGDGTFNTAVTYSVPSNSRFIHTADFNGDGKLDLVACTYEGPDISVLLGNGDGTFQTAVEYTTGKNLVDVAIGDFNGDGKLDMIASANADTNVYLLLGNGDGTFQTAQAIAVGFTTYEIATADLNADGKLDLAVQRTAGDAATLLGNGDGTFQAPQSFAGSPNALDSPGGQLRHWRRTGNRRNRSEHRRNPRLAANGNPISRHFYLRKPGAEVGFDAADFHIDE